MICGGVKVYIMGVSILEWNMRNQMDKTRWEEEFVTCRTCQKNVRPIDLPDNDAGMGDGFHTCPVCSSSLEKEIDRHERKYDLEDPR